MNDSRFKLPIIITNHAQIRMIERNITKTILTDIINTGKEKYRSKSQLWIYKHYNYRFDNLICAVIAIEDFLVIKTVMNHFTERE